MKYPGKNGFTLLEMAIVLVVIGLLTALGAGMMGPLVKRMKTNETRETIAAAREAIIGHAATTRKIPAANQLSGVVCSTRDAWSEDILYIPDAFLTSQDICARRTTGLALLDCGSDPNCSSPAVVDNLAFLLVSGGPDQNIQAGTVGVTSPPCPSGKTCIKVWAIGTPGVDAYSGDFTRAEEYDDIAAWTTLQELRIRAGCQGPQLSILNNDISPGKENESYSETIYAEGGVPYATGGSYRWCVEGEVPDGLNLLPSNVPNATSMNTTCEALPEASWGQADNLVISGRPGSGTNGSHELRVFVRDDNDQSGPSDNMATKRFVLTIVGGLHILNTEIPSGQEGSNYSAKIFADGGEEFSSGGRYLWCMEGGLPSGLTVTPNSTSTNCAGESEGSPAWGRSDSLVISGTLAAGSAGTYPLRVFVRDNRNPGNDPACNDATNKDACAEKGFVLTVHPSSTSLPPQACPSGYRVWNTAGATYDFEINGVCRNNIRNGREITTSGAHLTPGQKIDRLYRLGVCQSYAGVSLSYAAAQAADSDGDCMVNFSANGATDR